MSDLTPDILLSTINARYHHASLSLRTLRANLGPYAARAQILEFTAAQSPVDIAERLLACSPRLVALSVYVWNVVELTQVVAILKAVAPEVVVVLGGPEVSHEASEQPLAHMADVVVQGEGERVFREICERVFAEGATPERLAQIPWEHAEATADMPHVLKARLPDIDALLLPYDEYTEEDIARRTIYVEASRGCPYRCEFCLSSLDQQVRHFELERFLGAMQALLDRGARHFKFIDRTFNLRIELSARILSFFRERYTPDMFLHFEMVPDRLPEELRSIIASFPPGALQFEVGVQTLDDAVARRISRRQNLEKMADNLHWLRTQTGVHVHADLIAGLPGESLESFGQGLDRLWAMGPQEIQVGILKRLRGAPLARHTEAWAMVYSHTAPYEVLCTGSVDFGAMQRLKRFAHLWDRVVNRGDWQCTAPLIWGSDGPFWPMLALTQWVAEQESRVHAIALERMAALLRTWLVEVRGVAPGVVDAAITADFARTGRELTGRLRRLMDHAPQPIAPAESARPATSAHRARQDRHRQVGEG